MEQSNRFAFPWPSSAVLRKRHPKSLAADLPPEIIIEILRHVEGDDRVRGLLKHTSGTPTLPARLRVPAQTTLSIMARVCRMWLGIASEVLYTAPILLSPSALCHFARTVDTSTTLALQVKELILFNPPHKPKWYDTTRLRPQVISRRREGVRSRSRKNIEQILSVCTQLHSFSLSNLSTGPSRFFRVAPIRGLNPSALIEMRALSFRGDGAASFFGDGASSSLHLHEPARWTFANLAELNLTQVCFSGFASVAFPVLRRISVTGCIFMADFDKVLPAHSALLSDVIFAENVMVGYMDEPADFFAGWPHHALRSVTLGEAEWAVFCDTDWGLPGPSRVEILRIVFPAHLTYHGRGTTLPPSIRSLIAHSSRGCFEHNLCWDIDSKAASRHLEGLVVECLGWDRVSVSSLYGDDGAGLRWLRKATGVYAG